MLIKCRKIGTYFVVCPCLVAEGIGMQFLCFVYLEAKLVARVADAPKLLYRAQTDYTNGLDECVGRLQPRLLN